jgi:hypothetical protein
MIMAGKFSILAGLALFLCVTASAATDEFARVEVQGVLKNDFKAGVTTIQSGNSTFEVSFSGNRDLQRTAERFDGKTVLVSGDISMFQPREAGSCPQFVIDANRILGVQQPREVQYQQREVIREQPRERVIIEEKKPLFKAGPLEIK